MAPHTPSSPHRVVVVGGGFGGLQACLEARRGAGRGDARRPAQLPPLPAARLPGRHRRALAGRDLLPAAGHLPPPAQRARRARRGRRLRPRRAPRRACATWRSGSAPDALEYDTLIVAGGSQYSYFGHDEWQEHARRAQVARGRARRSAGGSSRPSRRPSSSPTPSAPGRAADLRRRRRRADRRRDGRARSPRSPATRCGATSASIDPTTARILLVEAADRVLHDLPAEPLGQGAARRSRASASRRCSAHGGRHRRATASPMRARRRRAPSASPTRTVDLGRRRDGLAAGAAARRARRAPRSTAPAALAVEPDLTLPGHPEVLALGDMVSVRAARRRARSSCPASRRSRCSRAATPRAAIRARLRRPRARAVPLPRQGQPRDDRPRPRGGRPQGRPPQRLPRLGRLARRPPLLPDRLPEPAARPHPLGVQLLHARPRRAPDRPRLIEVG